MKTESQIWRAIEKLEREIDKGGDYHDLKARQEALEWVLDDTLKLKDL